MTRGHIVALSFVLLIVGTIYVPLGSAYFCGYDDFLETHRAVYEDEPDPVRMFTTTHYNTPKYRPLNRGLNLITYLLGDGNPAAFRIRNIAFHLVSVAAVYGLAFWLFETRIMAVAASLLFGVHPLANQPVAGAVMTNTTANAFVLLSLFLFLRAMKGARRPVVALGTSLAALWLSLFFYEAGIVALGLMYGYIVVESLRQKRLMVSRRLLSVLVLGTVLVCGSFFGVRKMFVTQPSVPVPSAIMVRSLAMYVVALLLPIDPVLAHDYLHTPLPSQIRVNDVIIAAMAMVVIAIAAGGIVVALRRNSIRIKLTRLPWSHIVFLAGGAIFLLLPFLLFTDHPSETYLYPSVALWILVGLIFLRALLRKPGAFGAVIALFVLLNAAATWNRNAHVTVCGAAARRILSELPVEGSPDGSKQILLADFPTDPPVVRYGLYGYHGLASIDVGGPLSTSAQSAAQTFVRNHSIRVNAVTPDRVSTSCPPSSACFWVHADGHLSRAGTGLR